MSQQPPHPPHLPLVYPAVAVAGVTKHFVTQAKRALSEDPRLAKPSRLCVRGRVTLADYGGHAGAIGLLSPETEE